LKSTETRRKLLEKKGLACVAHAQTDKSSFKASFHMLLAEYGAWTTLTMKDSLFFILVREVSTTSQCNKRFDVEKWLLLLDKLDCRVFFLFFFFFLC
jgi:hypothetical protein